MIKQLEHLYSTTNPEEKEILEAHVDAHTIHHCMQEFAVMLYNTDKFQRTYLLSMIAGIVKMLESDQDYSEVLHTLGQFIYDETVDIPPNKAILIESDNEAIM